MLTISVQVEAGIIIGTVSKANWCADGHVHLSLRKGTDEYISPERYMEKRKMPPPEWVQECDHYLLVWKVRHYF